MFRRVNMDNQKIQTVYVFSTPAAPLAKVSSCLEEEEEEAEVLLKLHRLCTDALLVFYPDFACQSREEKHITLQLCQRLLQRC
jgi:hypothetical protein